MTDERLLALAEHDFVELTTFRRSGAPVRTPVWVVRSGDSLLVTTPARSGKVKRLRHTERVELVPCSRRGRVAEGAERLTATGRVDPDDGAARSMERPFVAKYGWQYRAFVAVESFVARLRRSPRPLRRIIHLTA